MRRLFFVGGLVGILIGSALGFVLSRSIHPWGLTGAGSADLRLELKDDYLAMIAADYMLDGDMALASRRAGSLGIANLSAHLERTLGNESRPPYRQALLVFSRDLDDPAVALARPTYTPRPTRTPTPIAIPSAATSGTPLPGAPTPTPMADSTEETQALISPPVPNSFPSTPGGPVFALKSYKSLSCQETGGSNTIQVQVEDGQGQPMPGIAVGISGGGRDEIAYTGLKPERGTGYADFTTGPGTYGIRLVNSPQSDIVAGLVIGAYVVPCPERATTYGWRIVFRKKN